MEDNEGDEKMKVRPCCVLCAKPALVLMLDRYFCGDCVAEIDRKNKEKMFEEIKNGRV